MDIEISECSYDVIKRVQVEVIWAVTPEDGGSKVH